MVLSTLAILMIGGIAFAEENCSDKFVENQIRKDGSKEEKELLSNPKKQFFQNFVNHAKKKIEFYGGMR